MGTRLDSLSIPLTGSGTGGAFAGTFQLQKSAASPGPGGGQRTAGGSLLCSVTNLPNNPGGLTTLLNNILGAL